LPIFQINRLEKPHYFRCFDRRVIISIYYLIFSSKLGQDPGFCFVWNLTKIVNESMYTIEEKVIMKSYNVMFWARNSLVAGFLVFLYMSNMSRKHSIISLLAFFLLWLVLILLQEYCWREYNNWVCSCCGHEDIKIRWLQVFRIKKAETLSNNSVHICKHCNSSVKAQ